VTASVPHGGGRSHENPDQLQRRESTACQVAHGPGIRLAPFFMWASSEETKKGTISGSFSASSNHDPD
jgi:hypothetical protein